MYVFLTVKVPRRFLPSDCDDYKLSKPSKRPKKGKKKTQFKIEKASSFMKVVFRCTENF